MNVAAFTVPVVDAVPFNWSRSVAMNEYAARRWLSPSLGVSLPAGLLDPAVVLRSVIALGTGMMCYR